jgi:hypothetical protein
MATVPLSHFQTVTSDDNPSSGTLLGNLSTEKLLRATKLKVIYEIVRAFPQGRAAFHSQDDDKYTVFKQVFKEVPVLKEIPNAFRLKVRTARFNGKCFLKCVYSWVTCLRQWSTRALIRSWTWERRRTYTYWFRERQSSSLRRNNLMHFNDTIQFSTERWPEQA